MATQKVTITLDEDLLREYKKRTKNLSAALNDAAEWWLALQRQNEALDEFERETGSTPDPEELKRARELLRGWQQRHSR